MRSITFSLRNAKEIIRDPLSIIFGVGFPVVLMLLLSSFQAKAPGNIFQIERLAPGIAVFGLSFISLFSGLLIAGDRTSSFLTRLFSSPMKPSDFIFGYVIPLIPIAISQIIICFLTAFLLGMQQGLNVLVAVIVLIPASLVFIGIGLLAGSIFNDKQVGPICGGLLINVAAWLSDTWFDLSLVGGAFEKIAYSLPFAHAVEATRASISMNYSEIFPHLWWVIGYAVVIMFFAVIDFKKKIEGN